MRTLHFGISVFLFVTTFVAGAARPVAACFIVGDCTNGCPECEVAACTGGTTFADGFCTCINATNGTPCTSDNNACTVDLCVSGTCDHSIATSGSPLCRPAAGGCDIAENCSGTTCPPDVKRSAGYVCRADAGPCDVEEVCDGTSPLCPIDSFEADGTSCSDGAFCNGDETCDGGGNCDSGAAPCPIDCNESLDVCEGSGCPIAALSTCLTAQRNKLIIKNKTPDDNDDLLWKWVRGQETTQVDFADPTGTANYALCIYATGSSLTMDIPPSSINWSPITTKGYKYRDTTLAYDGAKKVILKSGLDGKSKITLKGHGLNLPDILDSGALGDPVTVQLINHATGKCFTSTFTTSLRNSDTLYKARQP